LNLKRNLRNLSEIGLMSWDIIRGKYPAFIYGKKISARDIPAFCFHGVEPEPFEAMLNYLQDNDYTNITSEDLGVILLQKKNEKFRNPVCITFDDGVASMWTTAYPLLKKYGFRATVFLIPERIQSNPSRLPNLEDVWAGKATEEELHARSQGRYPFATWEEIREMHDSGVMDFQSHSLRHTLIFTSPKIIDFVNPDNIHRYSAFQFSMFSELGLQVPDKNKLRPGSPIYESAPRLAGKPGYLEDPGLKENCIGFVEDNGGNAFFRHKNWKSRLLQAAKDYRARHPGADDLESMETTRQLILDELKLSKLGIEEQLQGKKVEHLCLPWGVGSPLTTELSQLVGYKTILAGRLKDNIKLCVDSDPNTIYRVGPDFFYCLPGKGRKSVYTVMKDKVLRRAREGTHYLSY